MWLPNKGSTARRPPLNTIIALAVAPGCASGGPSVPPNGPLALARAAAPSIQSHERYYEVHGTSATALRDDMRRNGPATHGVTEDALTVWDLTWTYRDHSVDDGCVLQDVRVTLTVTVTLPHWTPPPDAPEQLIAAWTRFFERIRVHEAGHQTIAERSAGELASALSGLHSATCQALWTTAERLATRVVERGRAQNRAYDVETQHGQTQGVELGP